MRDATHLEMGLALLQGPQDLVALPVSPYATKAVGFRRVNLDRPAEFLCNFPNYMYNTYLA